MSFTRTASGLSNYSKFFGADVTIFVEGKKGKEPNEAKMLAQSVQSADELFHNAIFSSFAEQKKLKIKSVGCKGDLDTYARQATLGLLKNCIILYDSDYETITSTWMAPPQVMRTYGYSWENDLWRPSVCESVVDLFVGGRNWDRNKFHARLANAAIRLERASKVEVCCRVYGTNLIVPNGKSVGIRLNPKSLFGVDHTEISRVLAKVRQILRDLRDVNINIWLDSHLRNFSHVHLVRGHLWEAVCITLIVGVVKSIGACQTLPVEGVRNVALGVFTRAPLDYLSAAAKEHYRVQIEKVGL